MRSKFSKYLSGKEWLIERHGWSQDALSSEESHLTLGNGYLGSRGIYEEIPDGTEPGTYIAGVYDRAASMVPELVNAPNPIDFRIAVEGEKLDMGRMNVLEHRRVLDLKKGLLARRTVFSDTKHRRFLYESIRFFSLHNAHIGAMQIYLKALDKPARIIVQDTVDDSVTNIGGILEGRKRHTQLVDVSTLKDINYLCVKTFTKKVWISCASFLAVQRGIGQGVGTLNRIFNMSLKKGETICFTKIFSLYTSRNVSSRKLRKKTMSDLQQAKKVGFDALLRKHEEAWSKRWQTSDVKIQGDKEVQKALRFNIYHLLIAGKRGDDNVSIGARTLSGHGYRGHVFWDTEIFILPFFIYTDPRIARSLLMYRFRRLDSARAIAERRNYRGALFPWESADTGQDTTPPYAKNLDGTIIEINTMNMEHHIVSDIAYGIDHYFRATADYDFMLKAGLETVFEGARFWASRVTHNNRIKKFEIRSVIGPDEFHEDVNNNAYTNMLVSWHLRKAKKFYEYFERKSLRALRKIERKISLTKEEVEKWGRLAEKIKPPFLNSDGVIEEFEGYFRKRDVVVKTLNRNFMPELPADVPLSDLSRTQLVKQADVVMLLYLLPEAFTDEKKKKSYLYYVKRTLHKSSLSPSIYSIVASEIGDIARAYLFFLFSLYGDLRNMHANSAEGVHAASLGGTWQAVMMGFAGFSIVEDMPSFEPRLPGHWKKVQFSIRWRSCDLRISLSNKRIIFFAQSRRKGSLLVKCFNSVHKIHFNKEYTIYE